MKYHEFRTGPELVIDDRERGLFRVHRSVFTDPGILEMERERIFNRCWLYAAHESEVRKPGDFVTRRIAGRPVIVSHGQDGKIRVLLNSCTHRGSLICREARGNAPRHRCSYHGWTFTSEGELCSVPGEHAYSEAFDSGELNLREPRGGTSAYRGLIFVNFDSQNETSLEDYLGDARHHIDLMADQSAGRMEVLSGTHVYSVRCNYKLLAENSVDGYHALSTHRRYFDWLLSTAEMGEILAEFECESGDPTRFIPKDLGNGHSLAGRAIASWGRPMAQWVPRFGEERKPRFRELYDNAVERLGPRRAFQVCICSGAIQIFPNLLLNDMMSTNIRTYEPLAPGYVEVTSWCLGPEEEEPAERALRLDNFLSFLGPGGFSTPDDQEVVELCQRGYGTLEELEYSDVSRGMMNPDPTITDELQMRAYWRQWSRLMNKSAPDSILSPPEQETV